MADATEPGLGLLQGVDVATATEYSETLTYSADLLTKKGFFWSAAAADAESCGKSVEDYLDGLTTKFKAFMSSDHVFDRDGLKEGIRGLIEEEASISIVLGAKSIGKTKVFEAINTEFTKNESDVMVVYVNARELASGSLAKGIKVALSRMNKRHLFDGVDWKKVRLSLASLVTVYHETAGKTMTEINSLLDAMHVCGSVEDVSGEDVNFVELVIAIAEGKGKRPCLIIDEANLCLNGGEHEDAIVNQFLNRTKETKKLNIVLCSSKHSFPTQLERSGIQLGTVNLVQAEEPPPCAVWKFLTQEKSGGKFIIGMGGKLAKLCIALAGGNVYLIATAVRRLAERKVNFRGSQLVMSVEGGLAVEDVVENAAARATLKDLARVGYAAAATEATRSLLVEKAVAGLLTEDFTFYTDMERVVYDLGKVLVPSSSGLRNRIAFELQKSDSGEDAGESDTSSPRRS
jgi:hypothetical protein